MGERIPFYLLSLDLPAAHLPFPSTHEVSLVHLLKKYDGKSIHEDIKKGRRRLRLIKLPNFLIFSIRRFSKNNFSKEKNITRVNFPIKNLDCSVFNSILDQKSSTLFDLIASVSHEGDISDGTYKVYVYRRIEDVWYMVQDLTVVEVLPQTVALSQAYLQVYERTPIKSLS